MLKPLYVFAFLKYPDREDGWMSFNCIHLYVTQAQTPLTRVVTRPGMTDESHDHKTHYASGGILFKGAIRSNFKAVSGVNITSSVGVKSDNRKKKKKKCCSCLTKSISAVFQLLNISRTSNCLPRNSHNFHFTADRVKVSLVVPHMLLCHHNHHPGWNNSIHMQRDCNHDPNQYFILNPRDII